MKPFLVSLFKKHQYRKKTKTKISPTDRENSDDAIDSHPNYPLTLFLVQTRNDLHPDMNYPLAKTNNLRPSPPVPANECLVCARGDEVFGGERDAVQVAGELLKRCEC